MRWGSDKVDFQSSTRIRPLPGFQFRGGPYRRKPLLPLGSNCPVNFGAAARAHVEESFSAVVPWSLGCAGELPIRHQSVEGDGRLRDFDALLPTSTGTLYSHLHATDFPCRSAKFPRMQPQRRNHGRGSGRPTRNRQDPAINATSRGAGKSRID